MPTTPRSWSVQKKKWQNFCGTLKYIVKKLGSNSTISRAAPWWTDQIFYPNNLKISKMFREKNRNYLPWGTHLEH